MQLIFEADSLVSVCSLFQGVKGISALAHAFVALGLLSPVHQILCLMQSLTNRKYCNTMHRIAGLNYIPRNTRMANDDRTKIIYRTTPESAAMLENVKRAMSITAKLNRLTFNDADEIRVLSGELIGQKVD